MEIIIESLEKLGLSRYEAKAYIGLTKLISGKASEIAEISDIPRSKIYDVLKNLNKKGYIDIERGRPLKYKAIAPNEILKSEKEKLIEELDKNEEELTKIYNKQISEIQAPVWIIHSSENIIDKELKFIKKAKKSINMKIGFLLEKEGEALLKTLKEIPGNIKIKIIANRESYINNDKIEIIKLFESGKLKNLEVKEANIPFGKIIIIDGKELIRTFVKFIDGEKSIIPETAVGVYNQYQDICRNFDEGFLNQFNKIENSKKPIKRE